MLFILSPLILATAVTATIFVFRLWNDDSGASRAYVVLAAGGVGAVTGLTGTDLWCWLDRSCRTSLGDGMAEVMVLFMYSAGAALAGGLVGLLAGWLVRHSLKGRRAVLVAAPIVLLASPAWVLVQAFVL